MRVISDPGPFPEFSIEEPGENGRVFEPALEVVDGEAVMPDAEPGRGERPRREWIDRAQTRESR